MSQPQLYPAEFLDREIAKLEFRLSELEREAEETRVKMAIYRDLRVKMSDPSQLDPSANPETMNRRLKVAQAIYKAGGKLKAQDIATATGIVVGSLTDLMEYPWFEKMPGNRQAPYTLTPAGVRAVKVADPKA